jgi:DNA polymerase-3 subunit epsilon
VNFNGLKGLFDEYQSNFGENPTLSMGMSGDYQGCYRSRKHNDSYRKQFIRKSMNYAIVDIESTGGAFNEEGIIDIAVLRYEGNELTDQFHSLIDPEKPIQPFVSKLTGISPSMVQGAPKFYQVAKRIIELTENAILVAHNTQFDYKILQLEFDRLGYSFERKTLCTVELSQKLLPGLESYKLGKLTKELGIPLSDRHRALGDAEATALLLKVLISKEGAEKELNYLTYSEKESDLKPSHIHLVRKLPEAYWSL